MELPDPLTEEALHEMMSDPRYTDPHHPEHEEFYRLVQQGFELLYEEEEASDDAEDDDTSPAPDPLMRLGAETCPAMHDREENNLGVVSRGLYVNIGRCRRRPLMGVGDEGIG